MPEQLYNHDIAHAFYGICLENFQRKVYNFSDSVTAAANAGLGIDQVIIQIVIDDDKPKIDWQLNSDLIGKLQIEIGDFLIDEINEKYELNLSFDEIDELATKCIDVAKLRYK